MTWADRTRIGPAGKALFPDGKDWLFRPVYEGMCRYESIVDGTLTLEDIANMNLMIDSRQGGTKALLAAPPASQDPRVVAMLVLRAEGKTPATMQWKPWVEEVRVRSGAGRKQRGFSKRHLRRFYEKLPPLS